MKLNVGPAKYTKAGHVVFNRYESGELAMIIKDDRGEYQTKATVSLNPYGEPILPLGEVWLKGWSENAGVPEALAASGIVELTGRKLLLHYDAHAIHARLTERAMAAMNQQLYGSSEADAIVLIDGKPYVLDIKTGDSQ